MAKAAAAAALLDGGLDRLDGSQLAAGQSASGASGEIGGLGRSTSQAGPEIDRLSGRLALLAQTASAVGPALIPIGAVAVPAVTGLANVLGVTALAAGTTIFALQGVGDTLDAINTASLKPTTANLAAANAAFEALSPRAQEFVSDLRRAGPAFTELRDVAAAGLIPGLTDGFDGVLSTLPQVTTLLDGVSQSVGRLGEMTGDSLRSGEWNEFLTFLQESAPPAIESLGRSVGDFARGATDLWVAFEPLNNDFLAQIEQGSQSFADWSDGLARTDDFQEFVAYIRETGPQVKDTLLALGDAMLQIVEAVSPLGGPTLQIIESLAEAIATIADSPIGTPLAGLVAGMSALSLMTKGYDGARKAAFGSSAAASVKSTVGAMAQVTSATDRARLSSKALADIEATRSATIRKGLGSFGKQAGLLGGLALASSGAAESIGLTNTMSLGLLGTMGGPWGAAIGGAAGFVMDLKASQDSSSVSVDDLTASFNAQTGAITENTNVMIAKELQDQGAFDAASQLGISAKTVTDAVLGNAAAQRILNAELAAYNPGLTTDGMSAEAAAFANVTTATLEQNDAAALLRSTVPGLTDDFGKASSEAVELASVIGEMPGVSTEAGASLGGMGDQSAIAGVKLAQMVADQQEVAEALRKSRVEARETASSFFNIGEGVNDAKVSLGDWIGQMEAQAKALRDFRKNMKEASENGLRGGIIKDLQELGPEGALRMEQFADASDEEIRRANRAFKAGRDQVNGLAEDIVGVPNAKIDVDSAPAETKVRATRRNLRELADTRATAKLDANNESANSKIDTTKSKADGLTKSPRRLVIGADVGNALGGISAVQAARNALQDKTITLTTRLNTIRGDNKRAANPELTNSSALGNFFPATRAFALGDVVDGHQPEFAGPGMTRMWREPETGGESYIPHRNDSRRPRAKAITEQTAEMFGGRVEWFAKGGSKGNRAGLEPRDNRLLDALDKMAERVNRESRDPTYTSGRGKGDPGDRATDAEFAKKVRDFYSKDKANDILSRSDGGSGRKSTAISRFARDQLGKNKREDFNDLGLRGRVDFLKDFSRDARKELGKLEKSSEAASTALDAAETSANAAAQAVDEQRSALDGLLSDFNSLTSDIAGQFRSNLFEPMAASDVWRSATGGGGVDPIGVLTADLANSAEFAGLFASLQGRGLDGGALQAGAQGGVVGLQALAGYDDTQLQTFEDLFNQREAQTTATGQAVAQAQFGTAIAAQNVVLADSLAAQVEQNRLLGEANAYAAAQLAAVAAADRANQQAGAATEQATQQLGSRVQQGGRSRPRSGGRR